MDKKAQAEIITVVLIILLVLAAIIIVWQVIRSTIKESAEEVAGGTECITLDLDIIKYTAGDTNLTLKRNIGAGTLSKVRVIINGGAKGDFPASDLDELENKVLSPLTTALASGDEIEIAAILSIEGGKEKLCDIADRKTVA